MFRHLYAVIGFILVSGSSLASSNDCVKHGNRLSKDYGYEVKCYCGRDLSKLVLTLPNGLVLKRVCNLRSPHDVRAVDPRKSSISLDKYDETGSTLEGEFFIDGELEIAGRIRFEPSDGGDLWFIPSKPIFRTKTAFEPNFRQLRLPESAYSKIHLSRRLRETSLCSQAAAVVVLRGFAVVAYDSDSAGVNPQHVEIKSVSGFSPCIQGE